MQIWKNEFLSDDNFEFALGNAYSVEIVLTSNYFTITLNNEAIIKDTEFW